MCECGSGGSGVEHIAARHHGVRVRLGRRLGSGHVLNDLLLLVHLGLQVVVLGLLRGVARVRHLAELRFKRLEALLSRVVLLIELREQLLLLGPRVLGTVLEKGMWPAADARCTAAALDGAPTLIISTVSVTIVTV